MPVPELVIAFSFYRKGDQAARVAVCEAGAAAGAVGTAGATTDVGSLAGVVGVAGARPVGCGGNVVRVCTIFLLAFQSANSEALCFTAGAIAESSTTSASRAARLACAMPFVAAWRRLTA